MNRAFTASLALVFFAACSSSEAVAPSPAASTGVNDLDASSTEATMTRVTVGDFVFDVRVAGPKSGTPVILLHGFPETSYEWRSQLTALAKAGYRAIAPDQRGYSPRARPKAVSDYAIMLLAQDVVGIADAMGVDRFHLVGHDWGAAVAWVVARLSAARVLTVSPISVPHPDAFKLVLADQSSCQYTASSYFDLFTTPEATNSMISADAGFLRTVLAGLDPADIEVYVDALANFDAMDAALNWYRANVANRQIVGPELGKVTVPTTYIWSDGDRALCSDGAELTVNYVDAPYRFEIITGVSHWVPELAAEKVNELLLSRISGKP
jgi:pimeloyl-ACP methyl ester carboxylesterase